jgi:hypothetical protein
MANIKISDLTAAAAASGTQEFEVNDSLTSKKVTGSQILSYVQANTTPASIGAVSTADTIAVAKGGTGATTAATARSNLGTVADTAGNGIAARTSANTLTARTITAGTGISVTNGDGVAGNPTVTNSGVTSIVAGSNITISGGTGSVTISAAGGSPTTAQVLSATAGLTAGDVGSYGIFRPNTAGGTISQGSTIAGSGIKWSSCIGDVGGSPSGTWRWLGIGSSYDGYNWNTKATLAVRIS